MNNCLKELQYSEKKLILVGDTELSDKLGVQVNNELRMVDFCISECHKQMTTKV